MDENIRTRARVYLMDMLVQIARGRYQAPPGTRRLSGQIGGAVDRDAFRTFAM